MKTLRLLAALAAALATVTAHAVGRLADVSIFDRATGRELPVFWHDGDAWVIGRPGNAYRVVVRNAHGHDLLAVMSVDGVNVLTGETAHPGQGGYVIGAWNRLDVSGWRKSLAEVAGFYFTSLGDGYASRTGRPDNVGVIGVALFERRRPWRSPPQEVAPAPEARSPYGTGESAGAPSSPDAPRFEAKRAQQAPAAPLGTGHGERETSYARYVEFERATPDPVETIIIHYDSYRNLVARGVLAAPLAPRRPDPFPGSFVPDPT